MEWNARTIQEARDKRGLTQKELAEQLEVSITTVSDWETGKSRPRKSGIRAKLGDVLGSPPGGTPADLNLRRMPYADLTALLAAVAAETTRRLAGRDAEDDDRHPRDIPTAAVAAYNAADYSDRERRDRTVS